MDILALMIVARIILLGDALAWRMLMIGNHGGNACAPVLMRVFGREHLVIARGECYQRE